MIWTQKETGFLNDLQTQEQLCIDKYDRYAREAHDTGLKDLFNDLKTNEQSHLRSVNQMLSGTVPAASWAEKPIPAPAVSACSAQEKQQDAYLCRDSLSMEKHVSEAYDTAVFEFRDEGARDVLNRIQKDEQEHGKRLYDYMSANGMY